MKIIKSISVWFQKSISKVILLMYFNFEDTRVFAVSPNT